MHLDHANIRSQVLGNERSIWIQPPQSGTEIHALFVLLDAEYYIERMDAPTLIGNLQQSSPTPFAVAYVSHLDGATRWRETACNPAFAQFVVDELLPRLQIELTPAGDVLPTFIGGLSLTGLAAAHVAMLYPNHFAGVLCQSASFWWSDSWIVEEFFRRETVSPRFRISCGSQETTDYVEHGPGMIQTTSQLACNRALRDVLLQKKCDVSYEEFEGWHDIASWSKDLPRALTMLLSGPPT